MTSRARATASALLGLMVGAAACDGASARSQFGVGGRGSAANAGPSAGGSSSNQSSNGGEGGAGDPPMNGEASSSGLVCGDPTEAPCNTDPNCTTANAKSDATCTKDCKIGCGFDQLGTKLCSCVGGVYSQCPCPRPASYKGAEVAKYCDDPDFPSASETGLMQEMKGLPCETEWEQCVARDIPPGNTPRGCVCMLNPTTNDLQWYCGSTNKWFMLE